MSIALVSHVGFTPTSVNGGTTSAASTIGANLFVLNIARVGSGTTTQTPTDSAGNTWTALTVHTEGASGSFSFDQIWYCLNPTTSGSHTFSYSAASSGACFQVSAFSGVGGFDLEGGATFVGTNSVQLGAAIPSYDGSLIISAICDISTTHTIDSSFTVANSSATGSGNYGGALAYLIQSTAASINPTWTVSQSTNTACGGFVVFYPAVSLSHVVASASAKGVSSGTTQVANTTGAHVIVISVATTDTAGHFPIISDNKSNSWTKLTPQDYTTGSATQVLFYCVSPTVGSGHTFSFAASSGTNTTAMLVAAFDITPSNFDVQNGATGSGTTLATGSLTPSSSNSLVVSGCLLNAVGTAHIDSGFTIISLVQYQGSVNYGGALAYLVQTTAAAANPTWSLPTSGGAASIAAFGGGSGVLPSNTNRFFFAA